MSLTAKRKALDDVTIQVCLFEDASPLPFAGALRGLREEEEFRALFLRELLASTYPAYYWETPPVTRATLTRPFEFVLREAPELAHAAADHETFRHVLRQAHDGVASFDNLGADALLVAPTPPGDFPHLAAFTRTGTPRQQHALWRAVGAAAEERLGDEPLWISTSGAGVHWLHVRLDSWPKYYTHAPYREA